MYCEKQPKYRYVSPEAGFTLIELLVALTIGALIIASVFTAYLSQQKSYVTQDAVTEMQQHLRTAMYFLVKDIRMAGYDPSGDATAGITLASPGRMSMTMDLDGNGDTTGAQEQIDFGYTAAVDLNNDGIPDDGNPNSIGIQYNGAGGYAPFADNIESIEFRYLDKDGNVTANLGDIRSVQISLLAISNKPDRAFSNNITYNPASGVNANWKRAANVDNFRRRLLITTVVCRNMGI